MPKLISILGTTCISATFVVAGTGIGYTYSAIQQSIANGKGGNTSIVTPTIPELSNKDKFINNLIGSSSIKLSETRIAIDGLDQDQILYISSDDLAINILQTEDYEGSKNMVSGTLNISYGDIITESVGLYVNGEQATINFHNKLYSMKMNSLTDIFSIITSDDFPMPTIDGLDFEIPSMDKISEWGQNILSKITEEEGADNTLIYNFDLDPFGLVKIIADKETLTLRGIETPETLNFTLNGKTIHIKVSTKAVQDLEKSYTKDLPNGSGTINELDGVSGIFSTIANINKTRKFDSTISASLEGGQLTNPIDASLRLSGDFNRGDKPFLAQAELLSTNALAGNGTALVTYMDNKTYVSVNDKIKGYIDNTTISGLLDVFKIETNTDQIVDSLEDMASKFLEGTDLWTLINGDYSLYDRFLNDFNVTDNGTTFNIVVNTKPLGLTKDEQTFTLKLKTNSDKTLIESISICEFPFKDYKLNVSITLDSTTGENIKEFDTSSYGSYNGILPIAERLMNIVGEKKATLAYDASIGSTSEADYSLNFNGYISADLTQVELTKEGLLDAPIALSATTSIDNSTHFIEARRFDNVSYVSFDDVLRQKISDDSAVNIYKAVMDGLTDLESNENYTINLSEQMNKVTESIEKMIEKVKSLDSETITDVFGIRNTSCTDSKMVFTFDSSALGYEFGTIVLTLDATNDYLEIAMTGLVYGESTISLNVRTVDYLNPVSDVFVTGYEFDVDSFVEVTKFHNFITGTFDLVNSPDRKYGVKIDATLADSDYTSHLQGVAYFDINNGSYKGNIVYDMDKYSYDPYVEFAYNDSSITDESKKDMLFASYGHKLSSVDNNGNYVAQDDTTQTKKLYVSMHTNKLSELMEVVSGIQEDNILYGYYQKLTGALGDIPLMSIIKSKDYTQFLNDAVRNIQIADDSLTISLNPYYLGMSEEKHPNESINAVIYYEDESITNVKIDGVQFSGKTLDVSIDLVDYDENVADSTIDFASISQSSYLDFDYLPLALQLGLNSTTGAVDADGNISKNYTLSGSLKVNAKVLGISLATINVDVLASLHIVGKNDGDKLKVSAYIKVDPDYGSEYTEYYVRPEDEDCFIVKHENGYAKMILVDSQEMLNHIIYYLLGMGINFEKQENGLGATAYHTYLVEYLENLLSADSSSEEKTDGLMGSGIYIENLINSVRYSEIADSKSSSGDGTSQAKVYTNSGVFGINLDLSSLTDAVSLTNSLTINLYHGIFDHTGLNELLKIEVPNVTILTAAGVCSVNIAFTANQVFDSTDYTTYYDKYWAMYTSNGGQDNDYYYLKTVIRKNKGFAYWIEVTYKDGKSAIIVKDN